MHRAFPYLWHRSDGPRSGAERRNHSPERRGLFTNFAALQTGSSQKGAKLRSPLQMRLCAC
ncbi:hypothetical protein [Azospirillum largimobile]